MRGDRPPASEGGLGLAEFTPHARGSTHAAQIQLLGDEVYPACAGIDLTLGGGRKTQTSLPRMRGDRPMWIKPYPINNRFTPHARGSTVGIVSQFVAAIVYPACAGIDRLPLR